MLFLAFRFRRLISFVIIFVLLFGQNGSVRAAVPSDLLLPPLGARLSLTVEFSPPLIKGFTFDPKDPLRFGFIVDQGSKRMSSDSQRLECLRLVKNFFAALTVPADQMWVNLSPYEKDRLIPESFGRTVMGRDVLAQDYVLKQLTASIVYPMDDLGREFWKKVYGGIAQRFGNVDIPFDSFNKVWVMPDKAVVYQQGNKVFVVEKHLKVMLDKDYKALAADRSGSLNGVTVAVEEEINSIYARVVREMLIPEIEKEVNTGRQFVQLRQIYNTAILAEWFKRNLKDSLLGRLYVDKKKVNGVDLKDTGDNQLIYEKYVASFNKGVFNLLKDDEDPQTHEITPRKYFSGGVIMEIQELESKVDLAQLSSAQKEQLLNSESDLMVDVQGTEVGSGAKFDLAMADMPELPVSVETEWTDKERFMKGRVFTPRFIANQRSLSQKTIAIDLENTLVIHNEEGDYVLREGVEEALRTLSEQGYRFVLWTTASKALFKGELSDSFDNIKDVFDMVITRENYLDPSNQEIEAAYEGIADVDTMKLFYKNSRLHSSAQKDITLLDYALLVDDTRQPQAIIQSHPQSDKWRSLPISRVKAGEDGGVFEIFENLVQGLVGSPLKIEAIDTEVLKIDANSILMDSDQVRNSGRDNVGIKALALANFEQFMKDRGHPISIPRWVELPIRWGSYAYRNYDFVKNHSTEFKEKLASIAKGSDLVYGDPENPLLVSVRASNPDVREGYYVTMLNVGINDKTVAGLTKYLGSRKKAEELYAKYIRDFAIIVDRIDESEFQAKYTKDLSILVGINQSLTAEHASALSLDVAKDVYTELVGKPFPQDVNEQLNLVINSVVTLRRAGAKISNEINGVMIQRMKFGNLPESFSGAVISRNPFVGDRQIFGTASKEVEGDEVKDADVAGFAEFSRKYPEIENELELILREAEHYLHDIGIIEFTVERFPGREPELDILQIRKSFSTKEARVQILFNLVEEGIMNSDDARSEVEGMELEELKYEPVAIGKDFSAGLLGKADQIANKGLATGVVVTNLEQAKRLKEQDIRTFFVKPIVTAIDEDVVEPSIGGAQAIAALESFGWHFQAIAMKNGVPGVSGIPGSRYDEASDKMFVTIQTTGQEIQLVPEKTVLTVDRDGNLYVRDLSSVEVQKESKKKRKPYLSEALVEALTWQIEARGYVPEYEMYSTNYKGDIFKMSSRSRTHYEYEKGIKAKGTLYRNVGFVGVSDVIQGVKTDQKELNVEERVIDTVLLEKVVSKVLSHRSNTEDFTYWFWTIYNHFDQEIAEAEGIDIKQRKVKYSNFEEMRGAYVKRVAIEDEEGFVKTVFYGVDHHKMAQYIFSAAILSVMDKDFARDFFTKVVAYGAQYGYSGDNRARDYQSARLYSHFAKIDADFAKDVIAGFNKKERLFLLDELNHFYILRGMRTKTKDKSFAKYFEIHDVLEEASKVNPELAQESEGLRESLLKKEMEISKAKQERMSDQAMSPLGERLVDTGGIDMDTSRMDLQLRRDSRGVVLSVDQQQIDDVKIEGIIPSIVKILPVNISSLLMEKVTP